MGMSLKRVSPDKFAVKSTVLCINLDRDGFYQRNALKRVKLGAGQERVDIRSILANAQRNLGVELPRRVAHSTEDQFRMIEPDSIADLTTKRGIACRVKKEHPLMIKPHMAITRRKTQTAYKIFDRSISSASTLPLQSEIGKTLHEKTPSHFSLTVT
jgi:hypothetical protein